ncbi:uncharacterized protein LOC142322838 [Lycorma delicatula]|uniref:uncharacterized protein LOC142322838 n=1 Tax=Lycorma delicatula TaxID=130591 RepID=UPI003F51910C
MTEYLRSPLFQLKVGELILSLISAILFFTIYPTDKVLLTNIVHLTVFGYILLNILVIFSVVIQEPLSRSLFLLINGSGGILFIISGIIMVVEFVRLDISIRILAAGLIAILNGVVYCGDTYYIIMYFQD